jgi:hypothetical protein
MGIQLARTASCTVWADRIWRGRSASIIDVPRAFSDLGLQIDGDRTFSCMPDEESDGMARGRVVG